MTGQHLGTIQEEVPGTPLQTTATKKEREECADFFAVVQHVCIITYRCVHTYLLTCVLHTCTCVAPEATLVKRPTFF